MKLALIALTLSGALAGAGQLPRADHVLDIVGYRLAPDDGLANPDAARLPAGSLGGASHEPSSQLNVKVTLGRLDRLSYQTGDSVVFELWIENVGARPVMLPWSPDRAAFKTQERTEPPLRKASLFLEVRDRSGFNRLAWLEPQLLFGSETVDGSLITLAPREKALIRAPGYWRTSDGEMAAVLREPNGIVQVSVVLHLFESRLMVRSKNGIEVAVQDRLHR